MAVELSPEWRFTAFPQDAISNRRIDAFVVADLMADLLQGSPSTFAGIISAGAVGGVWNDWTRLGNDLSVHNVGFSRFLPSGEIGRFPQPGQVGGGGFYVLPQRVAKTPLLDAGGAASPWSFQTQSGDWRVVPALQPGGSPGLYNVGSDEVQIVTASGPLRRNQQISIELEFLNIKRTGPQNECLLPLGKGLRLAFRQGMPPALEHQQTTTQGNGSSRTQTTDWGILRTMDALGEFDPRGARHVVTISHLGGRLQWQVDGHSLWMLDAKPNTSQSPVQNQPLSFEWGQAPLSVECHNLRARVEFSTLEHPTELSKTGTVTRRVPVHAAQLQGVSTSPLGGGHLPDGASIPVTATLNGDVLEYTATLKVSDDHASPLLSQILLRWAPVWVSGSPAGVNISAAVQRSTVTLAHPPVQAGAEGSLEVDLPLLGRITGALNATKDFCPIEISARTRDSSGDPRGAFKGIFRGHLFGTNGDIAGYNQAKATFTLRDPIVRLRKPASIVDGRAYPLDWTFYERLALLSTQTDPNATSLWNNGRPITDREKRFYDGDAVQDILTQFMGPDFAATLNGNGDPLRFLPEGHPPLLDYTDAGGAWLPLAAALGAQLTAGSLQAQEGAIFPPSYKQDALSWINKFCADMFTVFFMGYIDRDTDPWPVPIYGRYEQFLLQAALWLVPGDVMQKLSTQTKSESDINRVWLTANPFGASKIPLQPSLVQGDARVLYGPNAARNSWERTQPIETNLAVGAYDASAAAAIALSESESDSRLQWPSFTVRGTLAQPGDLFITAEGNRIGVNGLGFRSARIEHEYVSNAQERRWDTTAFLQTLSRTQLQSYLRLHEYDYLFGAPSSIEAGN